MTEIVQYNNHEMFMPVMNIDMAVQRHQSIVSFYQKLMVLGTDYGKVPGTGDKPVLLKPGAEKLATLFGLTPVFVASEVIEDWTGKAFDGEPMFYYRYKCELYRGGTLIATSEGSCNSRESKYRYRKAERVCPQCGQAAIIKGKTEYGGGWVCFAKKSGCGAKFKDGDPVIESQETGRVFNPDIADQVNTIQKMAQKRALVGSILLAVNASEFFTQDIEDVVDGSYAEVVEDTGQPAQTQKNAPQSNQQTNQHRPPRKPTQQATAPASAGGDAGKLFHKRIADSFGGMDVEEARHWYISLASGGSKKSANELTESELTEYAEDLRKNVRNLRLQFQQWQAAQSPQPEPEVEAEALTSF